MRPTDQQMIAIEKAVCSLSVLKVKRHATLCGATWGGTRGCQETGVKE